MASSRINQKSEELKMLWRIIYPKVGKPRDIGDNTDIYLSYGKVLTAYVAERKKTTIKYKSSKLICCTSIEKLCNC